MVGHPVADCRRYPTHWPVRLHMGCQSDATKGRESHNCCLLVDSLPDPREGHPSNAGLGSCNSQSTSLAFAWCSSIGAGIYLCSKCKFVSLPYYKLPLLVSTFCVFLNLLIPQIPYLGSWTLVLYWTECFVSFLWLSNSLLEFWVGILIICSLNKVFLFI